MNEQIMATRIKELRSSLNLTQNEFGKLIGVAQTTLSSYEKESKLPNLEALFNIADKCNVSIDWLCGLSDIQKTKDFTSYSDIFRLLVNICKSVHINIDYDFDGYNNCNKTSKLIAINNEVDEFLDKWLKIKAIYDEGTLDNDMYEIIIKSLIDKYKDIELKYDQYQIIDDDIVF